MYLTCERDRIRLELFNRRTVYRNLEKNNELVEFHQQQVTRYLEESILWERRLNAVEEEVGAV